MLLHDHLDGGLRPQTVLELADEAGYRELPAADAESLGRWFRQAADSGSLVQYLETFAHTVGVMQRPEAIHRVARECALDLAADGVVYAEVRFAPELSTAQGLAIEDVVEAMVDGFSARQPGGHRGRHPDPGRRAAVRDAAERPVGRGRRTGGPLPGRRRRRASTWPGRRSASRRTAIPSAIGMLVGAGAHRTIHAGEADGIESIRAALDGAHAERLGHGVRIADEVADDGTLGPVARRVLDEQVTLEIAPSSNVQTGAYPSLAAHPVDRLHRLGFAVTVNTDNRLMSGVSASSEVHRRRHHVRVVAGTTSRRSPSGRWPARSCPIPSGTGCSATSSGPGTRRCAADPRGGVTVPTPAPGIAK